MSNRQVNWGTCSRVVFEDYLIGYEFTLPGLTAVLDFVVVHIAGEHMDPIRTPIYQKFICGVSNFTSDVRNADVFLHGHIKWDGCSNWHFDEQDAMMLHFCGARRTTSIGRLMAEMYRLAAATIPEWDAELAA